MSILPQKCLEREAENGNDPLGSTRSRRESALPHRVEDRGAANPSRHQAASAAMTFEYGNELDFGVVARTWLTGVRRLALGARLNPETLGGQALDWTF